MPHPPLATSDDNETQMRKKYTSDSAQGERVKGAMRQGCILCIMYSVCVHTITMLFVLYSPCLALYLPVCITGLSSWRQ